MKYKTIYFLISAIVIVPGIFSLITHGLKLSIEFTGGTHLTLDSVRSEPQVILDEFQEFSPQIEARTENSITLKTQVLSESAVQQKIEALKAENPDLTLAGFETIGPALGQETIQKTINALVVASVLLLAYISLSFKQIKYGLCAILAMFHDTAILLGSFSLLGWLYGIEVDLLFVTAVLTILSFSVHDTIVVYDRIRELGRLHKDENFTTLVNRAVTETMTRSLNNSLTIIFMLLAMFLLGGQTIKFFSLALLIGTVTGTYSSTFTAAPLLVVWEKYFKSKKS